MIRFLQTPGPIKKIVLGGLLTIISVFMVITLVPGFGNTDFFGSTPTRGIVAKVADAEVRQKFEKENTKVKFDYAVLRKDDILKGLHPTDPELKAYYDRNKATYNNSLPEKRKIKYVLVDTAKIKGEAQVSQQD